MLVAGATVQAAALVAEMLAARLLLLTLALAQELVGVGGLLRAAHGLSLATASTHDLDWPLAWSTLAHVTL